MVVTLLCEECNGLMDLSMKMIRMYMFVYFTCNHRAKKS
jgi:hypothetical protein